MKMDDVKGSNALRQPDTQIHRLESRIFCVLLLVDVNFCFGVASLIVSVSLDPLAPAACSSRNFPRSLRFAGISPVGQVQFLSSFVPLSAGWSILTLDEIRYHTVISCAGTERGRRVSEGQRTTKVWG